MTRLETIFEVVFYGVLLGMVGAMAYLYFFDVKGGMESTSAVLHGLAVLLVGVVWVVTFLTFTKIGRHLEKAICQRLWR